MSFIFSLTSLVVLEVNYWSCFIMKRRWQIDRIWYKEHKSDLLIFFHKSKFCHCIKENQIKAISPNCVWQSVYFYYGQQWCAVCSHWNDHRDFHIIVLSSWYINISYVSRNWDNNYLFFKSRLKIQCNVSRNREEGYWFILWACFEYLL